MSRPRHRSVTLDSGARVTFSAAGLLRTPSTTTALSERDRQRVSALLGAPIVVGTYPTDLRVLREITGIVAGEQREVFPDGCPEALGKALCALEALSDGTLAALRAVVNYDWQTEERDYHEQAPENRGGHVFEHLQLLDDLLQRCTRHGL
jgi:hypothetical protein